VKNWKTTAAALLTTAAGFVALNPELFVAWPFAVALAKYVGLGGLATMGIVGHDAKKEDPPA